jgi:5'-methylthioadenosine phosphorylase
VDVEIGIFGGSGLYQLLDGAAEIDVATPYGAPSAPIVVGEVSGRGVAFLPRHGVAHQLPAHRIPYLANVWALHSLGVRQILAPCAVGSLQRAVAPGDLVICDQLVDRTSGRRQTFYDDRAVHISFADPYCPVGRAAALSAAPAAGLTVHDRGTMVVVEGPRFSTRAESSAYSAAGWSVINMTGHPEAALARELAVCYTALALVTDYDVGIDDRPAVTADEVFRVFAANIDRLRGVLFDLVPMLPRERDCDCVGALDGADLTR